MLIKLKFLLDTMSLARSRVDVNDLTRHHPRSHRAMESIIDSRWKNRRKITFKNPRMTFKFFSAIQKFSFANTIFTYTRSHLKNIWNSPLCSSLTIRGTTGFFYSSDGFCFVRFIWWKLTGIRAGDVENVGNPLLLLWFHWRTAISLPASHDNW